MIVERDSIDLLEFDHFEQPVESSVEVLVAEVELGACHDGTARQTRVGRNVGVTFLIVISKMSIKTATIQSLSIVLDPSID